MRHYIGQWRLISCRVVLAHVGHAYLEGLFHGRMRGSVILIYIWMNYVTPCSHSFCRVSVALASERDEHNRRDDEVHHQRAVI